MKRAVLFWIIIIVIGLTFIPGFARLQELKTKNRQLNRQIISLKTENLALQKEVEKLQTDSVYLERVAREKMGVVKKGEVVYHIVPEEKKD
jgi:cell division protein FtsB